MNYDRRYSPSTVVIGDSPSRNPIGSRSQAATPRGVIGGVSGNGVDSRAQYYGREYPPLRSRSQTHIDQDYGDRYSQQPPFYENRALERNSRSKSLDAREFRGDDGYYRDDYLPSGVLIPIRRESGRPRQFDSRTSPRTNQRLEFESYPPIDDRRGHEGGEVHIPYNSRDVQPLPSRDFGPPRRSFDERAKYSANQYREADSPKSYSSRYQGERRAIDYGERERERGGGFSDDFERDEFPVSGPAQPYRSGIGGGASSGHRSSNFHRSHYESHGGHEAAFGGANLGPRTVTQQPQGFYPDGRPIRPIQHHRVQCCCFKFVWPPWSYEQAPPPQPIYRNI